MNKAGYEDALERYRQIRKSNTRVATSGRPFVLVQSLAAQLQQPLSGSDESTATIFDGLYRWVESHTAPSERRHLDQPACAGRLAIFFILVELELPKYVSRSMRGATTDAHLPLNHKQITDLLFLNEDSSSVKRFHDAQFEWCPISFYMGMDLFYAGRVLPVYRKTRFPSSEFDDNAESDSTLWQVEVPGELVDRRLKEAMPAAVLGERDDAESNVGEAGLHNTIVSENPH